MQARDQELQLLLIEYLDQLLRDYIMEPAQERIDLVLDGSLKLLLGN
jgi:hypothetical protein